MSKAAAQRALLVDDGAELKALMRARREYGKAEVALRRAGDAMVKQMMRMRTLGLDVPPERPEHFGRGSQ